MTLINVAKESIGLAVFTKDNHRIPVFRFGQYNRLTEPGYSPITPFIENAGTPFKTSIRVLLTDFEDCDEQR